MSTQTDPVDSHRKFKKEHKLPFTLLSDLTVLDASLY
jgi:peroxiredoxin